MYKVTRFCVIASLVALLLGLGVPKAFSLLYLGLLVATWLTWRDPWGALPRPLIWSFIWLGLFGFSYAVFQVGWKVWSPSAMYLGEILAVVILPALGLLTGWRLKSLGQSFGTRLLLSYVAGALIYSLVSLAISRTPWWNIGEIFLHVVRAPWGYPAFLSTRAVEQRAFLSLVLLPVGLPLLRNAKKSLRYLGAGLIVMACLATHVAWALQGRIGLAALALSLTPCLWLLRRVWMRYVTAFLSTASIAIAVGSGYVCDERPWLIGGFLANLHQSPWGGRLIRFSYLDCTPYALNHFGSFKGSSSFTPHNLILDIYNDAGWIPTVCLLMAILPLLWLLLIGFWRSVSVKGWTWPLALRWSFLSVLLVEWLAQPFLYTDQLMFSIGFVVAGILLAEFSPDQSVANMPSC